MYYNKVVLVGTVGNAPRFKDGEYKEAFFPLVQKKAWINKKTKQRHEETQYHRIELSGALLKNSLPILIKGKPILVEGELISKSIEGIESCIFSSEVFATLIKKFRPES